MIKSFDTFFARLKNKRKLVKRFKTRLGYKPNLKRPRTYCEKIQWCKLHHNHHSQYVITRSDKLAVRKVIQLLGYNNILLDHYGNWDNVNQIDWDQLPDRFILKINNRSGDKYIWKIANKAEVDLKQLLPQLKQHLAETYGIEHHEYHYQKIPSRLYAEQYLDPHEPLKDYKFYCFAGKVDFFSIEVKDPQSMQSRSYHNPDFSNADVAFANDLKPPTIPFEQPINLQFMVTIAETLSDNYPHVRVDLYNIDGKVYFGELTYVPESGYTRWIPTSLDHHYGEKIYLKHLK
jgi:hypothetical protein